MQSSKTMSPIHREPFETLTSPGEAIGYVSLAFFGPLEKPVEPHAIFREVISRSLSIARSATIFEQRDDAPSEPDGFPNPPNIGDNLVGKGRRRTAYENAVRAGFTGTWNDWTCHIAKRMRGGTQAVACFEEPSELTVSP